MYSTIAANKRNTIIIFMVFIAVIGGIGLFLSSITRSPSMFIFTIIGGVVYSAVEYFFASKIAIAMTGAQEVSRHQSPEFYAAVESISITAGIPMPKVYIINDPSPNAFAAGLDPKSSIICATTGLIYVMNKSELEAVVAHEISHIQNYDVRVSMAAFALAAAIGFISDIAWRVIFWFSDDDVSPVAFIVGIVISILSPIAALIIRLAISREREFLADSSAVLLTRHPDAMISALSKLKDLSSPLKRQSSVSANLFFVNPLKPSFLSKMFSTHPTIEERILRIEQNKGRF